MGSKIVFLQRFTILLDFIFIFQVFFGKYYAKLRIYNYNNLRTKFYFATAMVLHGYYLLPIFKQIIIIICLFIITLYKIYIRICIYIYIIIKFYFYVFSCFQNSVKIDEAFSVQGFSKIFDSYLVTANFLALQTAKKLSNPLLSGLFFFS